MALKFRIHLNLMLRLVLTYMARFIVLRTPKISHKIAQKHFDHSALTSFI
jgi:hypothetical protein